MKEGKLNKILLIISGVIVVSSCSTIQKRRYNSGFAFNGGKQRFGAIEVEYRKPKPEITAVEETVTVPQSDVIDKPQTTISKNKLRDKHLNNCIKRDLMKGKVIQYYYPLPLLNCNRALPVKDSIIKKQDPPTNQLPREPLGEIAFWLVIGSLASILLILALAALETVIPGIAVLALIINIFRGFAMLAGLILGILSLYKYRDNPGMYRGKDRARAAVIISSVIIGLALLASIILLVLLIAMI